MFVLGIDAGGTKTVCLMADAAGHIVGEARGPGANLQVAGELEVEKTLHRVMDEAMGGQPAMPAAICLGIAGVDRSEDAAAVRGLMRRIGHRARTLVVNDALVALVAGAGDGPGLVVVAGTGSIAYGRNAQNEAARAGGWGYVIGDEGSGYWIGRHALGSVVRQSDGRGPTTRLTPLVLTELGLTRPGELVHEVYYEGLQRHRIAALAQLVQQARDEGDVVAAEILGRAASHLVNAATSVVLRLGMRGDAFPTVLAGGIFKVVPWLRDEVARRFSEVAPRSPVEPLAVEPAVGAVHLALAEARGGARLPSYL